MATRAALQEFQRRRGLRVDGICGPQTWSALVEAGYRLGDRLLYLRRPMLRGDDVAELQRQLGALGFDAGRVDGIFGHRTAVAVADFQRNVAVTVDGMCGRATTEELSRLSARSQHDSLVAAVREREHLRQAPSTLWGRRIGVGHGGGLGAMAESVRRSLGRAGAEALVFLHPDGSHLAAQANAAEVDAYLGLRLDSGAQTCHLAYYSGYRYHSGGGRRLAELGRDQLAERLGIDAGVAGMSLPELRESRMTAVVCELGPPAVVVERSAELAQALRAALANWAAAWA